MAIGNVDLMQKCFTKHSCMGTAKMKSDIETVGQKKTVNMKKVQKSGNNISQQPNCSTGYILIGDQGHYYLKKYMNYPMKPAYNPSIPLNPSEKIIQKP